MPVWQPAPSHKAKNLASNSPIVCYVYLQCIYSCLFIRDCLVGLHRLHGGNGIAAERGINPAQCFIHRSQFPKLAGKRG